VIDRSLADVRLGAALRNPERVGWRIALTGYAHPEDPVRASGAGFDHHLSKSLTVEASLAHSLRPGASKEIRSPTTSIHRRPPIARILAWRVRTRASGRAHHSSGTGERVTGPLTLSGAAVTRAGVPGSFRVPRPHRARRSMRGAAPNDFTARTASSLAASARAPNALERIRRGAAAGVTLDP
jgi:hypothetical protein